MQKTYLKNIVKAALMEDVGTGDITTNSLVSASTKVQARLTFKSDGVLCGLNVAECVFKTFSRHIHVKRLVQEGAKVKKGTVVAIIKGPARQILTAERVAINFLTHLSSIATHTRTLVDHIKPYKSKIFDTRKTTPLLRQLERYAVHMGGGHNHRFNLAAMVMIKDNHRNVLAKHSLKSAVEIAKKKTGKMLVLEVDTWEEFKDALLSKADVILLDNMSAAMVAKAIVLRNRINRGILLEASGGINFKNVRAYAKTGVERISVGSLTSIKEGIDISLDFV